MDCIDSSEFGVLTLAIEWAARAHDGQKDMQGVPYIFHPLACLAEAQRRGYDLNQQAAMVLHDVVEDNDEVGLSDLAEDGFPADVVYMVNLLTRPDDSCMESGCNWLYDREEHFGGLGSGDAGHYFKPGGPEMPYIDFIYRLQHHPRAARLKLIDIDHNLARIAGVTDPDKAARLVKKYLNARNLLILALEPHGGR